MRFEFRFRSIFWSCFELGHNFDFVSILSNRSSVSPQWSLSGRLRVGKKRRQVTTNICNKCIRCNWAFQKLAYLISSFISTKTLKSSNYSFILYTLVGWFIVVRPGLQSTLRRISSWAVIFWRKLSLVNGVVAYCVQNFQDSGNDDVVHISCASLCSLDFYAAGTMLPHSVFQSPVLSYLTHVPFSASSCWMYFLLNLFTGT